MNISNHPLKGYSMKKQANQPTQIRQGDVYLIPVEALPAGCKHIEPEGGRL
jgi:hypothetical protein